MVKFCILFLFVAAPYFVKAQIDYYDHLKAIELNNIAIKKIEKRNNKQAIPYLIQAIHLDSTFRNAYIALNNACSIGDSVLLKSHLKKATQIFIEDDEILYYLGNCHRLMGQTDSAIISYSKAIEFSKKNGEDYPIVYAYYLNRGLCYFEKELYVQALQDFNYGIRLKPEKTALYINKAILLYQLGNKNQACTEWQKAAILGSEEAKSYLTKHCQ